jgi:hypothetical protein
MMQRLAVDEPVGLRIGADQARRDDAHAWPPLVILARSLQDA